MKVSRKEIFTWYENLLGKELDLGIDYPTISSVVPTYNRCPYYDSKRNPLYYSIRSLATQKYPPSKREIIIIDDNSNDFTRKTVNSLKRKLDVCLIYKKHSTRHGSGSSRNDGAEIASGEFLNFLDDDTIPLTNNYLNSFLKTYEIASTIKNPVGAIVGYTFQRRSSPKVISKRSNPPKIDSWGVRSNFGSIPEEIELFGDFPLPLMHERLNLCGNILVPNNTFKQVGGFPIMGGNQYWEETVFSCKLSRKGFQSFMNLDPRGSVLHLRWGTPNSKFGFCINPNHIKIPFEMESLDQLIKDSSIPRYGSGNRCSGKDWAFYKLRNYGYVLAGLPLNIALLNMLSFYILAFRDFVLKDSFLKFEREVTNFGERGRVYIKALSESLKKYLRSFK